MTPKQDYLEDIDRMLIDLRHRIGLAADKADFPEEPAGSAGITEAFERGGPVSQRKRIGRILDVVDPELDPGNLCLPLRQPKAPPICHCAPPEKGRWGGMSPVIAGRDAGKVVCRTCQREIGPGAVVARSSISGA